jgi:hypothetical protein
MSNKEDLTNPTHYKLADGKEVIDVLKEVLTREEYTGYLRGNALKYAFRLGKKRHITTDMALQFMKMLPKGNEALLRDDVVRHFTAWQAIVNGELYDVDAKKRNWYISRLEGLGITVGGYIDRILGKYSNN